MALFDIVGNPAAITILTRAVASNKLPHALLFSGPSGVGKKNVALSLAKAILGEIHAKKIDKGIHPDVKVFIPEGKGQMHPISAVENITGMIALKPFESQSRFIIIDDAEKMLPTSSNALLKTLEEPQPNNYFVLITAHPEHILSTITSRCSKVSFFPIPTAELSSFLTTSHSIETSLALRSSHLSGGSFSRAYTIATTQKLGVRENLLSILSTQVRKLEAVRAYIDAIDQQFSSIAADEEKPFLYFDEGERMFEEILYWQRDLQALKAGCDRSVFYHQDKIEELEKSIELTSPSYQKVVSLIGDCRLALHRSIKMKNILEYFFISLWSCS